MVSTLALLSVCSPSFAAKYAGEFLEIGVGARGVAMGGAMSALVNDPSSFYWNPAGLSYVAGTQADLMYADLWEGLANYSVVGLTVPVSAAMFAAHWVRLGVPDIQQHADYDQYMNKPDSARYVIRDGERVYYNSVQEYLLATGAAPTGIFGDSESAVFLSFAKMNKFTLDLGWSYFNLPIELPLGANVKIIQQSLGGANGSGVGADLGGQIRLRTSDLFNEHWKATLSYGFNWQDLTRTALDWGESNKDAVPPNFRNGVALQQQMPGKHNALTLSLDYEHRWERNWHYGAEYSLGDVLALRGGMWNDEWTAGAGVSFWRATVDYAYRGRDLGVTHRVSLGVRIR